MTYLSHVHLKTHFLLMVIYYETDIHESKIRYLKSIKNFLYYFVDYRYGNSKYLVFFSVLLSIIYS